jgi:7 transmembrane receptor (rhodopsin family)
LGFTYSVKWLKTQEASLSRIFIISRSTNVSVLTIVAFSMERFVAICHPLHLHTMSGLQRPIRVIAVIWVVSFICALPFAVFSEIDIIRYPKGKNVIFYKKNNSICFFLLLFLRQFNYTRISVLCNFTKPTRFMGIFQFCIFCYSYGCDGGNVWQNGPTYQN